MSYTKQLVNEEFVSNYELKSAKKVYGKNPGWCAKIQFKKKKKGNLKQSFLFNLPSCYFF